MIEAADKELVDVYHLVKQPKLGIVQLLTPLKNRGITARGIAEILEDEEVDYRNEPWVKEADLVGISILTTGKPKGAKNCRQIKSSYPEKPVVFGGPGVFTKQDAEILLKHSGADYAIRGPGDRAFPMLIEALNGKISVDDVPSLTWRTGDTFVHNKRDKKLTPEEFNALPDPDFTILRNWGKLSVMPVCSATGCDGRCTFCQARLIWGSLIEGSPSIAAERLLNYNRTHDSFFLVNDNSGGPALEKTLKIILERGFKGNLILQMKIKSFFKSNEEMDELEYEVGKGLKNFVKSLRHGHLNLEVFRLLRSSTTTTTVCLGIESASDDALETIGKGVSIAETELVLQVLGYFGILRLLMVIFLADYSYEDIRRLESLVLRYGNIMQLLFETPLAGTLDTKKRQRQGLLVWDEDKDFEMLRFFNGMVPLLRTTKMSEKEMVEEFLRLYANVYSTKRIVKAGIKGSFFRWRVPNRGQWLVVYDHLKKGRPDKALASLAWYQTQFKLAPASLLRTGQKTMNLYNQCQPYSWYMDRFIERINEGKTRKYFGRPRA